MSTEPLLCCWEQAAIVLLKEPTQLPLLKGMKIQVLKQLPLDHYHYRTDGGWILWSENLKMPSVYQMTPVHWVYQHHLDCCRGFYSWNRSLIAWALIMLCPSLAWMKVWRSQVHLSHGTCREWSSQISNARYCWRNFFWQRMSSPCILVKVKSLIMHVITI